MDQSMYGQIDVCMLRVDGWSDGQMDIGWIKRGARFLYMKALYRVMDESQGSDEGIYKTDLPPRQAWS